MCITLDTNLCKLGGLSNSTSVSNAQNSCVNKFNMVIKA